MSVSRAWVAGGLALTAAAWWSGCAPLRPSETNPPAPTEEGSGARPEVRYVTDPALEQRIARLELLLLEREAQVRDLQTRLDEARREVVRTMAKLQTVASRAEAASAIAEAEIAIQTWSASPESATEIGQGRQLLQMSSAEFDRQNYGGALYLANQAKGLVRSGQGAGPGFLGARRPGETAFAAPLPLQATSSGNVRDGPGMGFRVLFTVDRGVALTGHSLAGEWVRVSDEMGRSGWIFLTLVGRR
ncbi:MAG: SH3 domain-containing protein [Gemmatimonadota bacterium]